jgi:hypothetical protein
VNEVFFRARPHHNVHSTLGVDIGATSPRWRVDSIDGGGVGGGGREWKCEMKEVRIPTAKNLLYDSLGVVVICFLFIYLFIVWYHWYRLVIF